jgi:hypothetical protein
MPRVGQWKDRHLRPQSASALIDGAMRQNRLGSLRPPHLARPAICCGTLAADSEACALADLAGGLACGDPVCARHLVTHTTAATCMRVPVAPVH